MASRLTAVRFTLKQESTSNKSSRFLKGHFAPFFVLAFLSVTLMFAIVAVVYHNNFLKVHTVNEMLVSFLYVLVFTAIQCLAEEFIFRYSVLLVYERVSPTERLRKISKIVIEAIVVVIVSFLFAFMHFGDSFFLQNVPLFFYYFLIGVYFSILTIRFKSIVLSFSLHFFNNLYTFLFVMVGESLTFFHPLFKLEINPDNMVFLSLNFVPLVLFTEILLKIFQVQFHKNENF